MPPSLEGKEPGTIIQGGKKRISGYEIQQDGNASSCMNRIPVPEQDDYSSCSVLTAGNNGGRTYRFQLLVRLVLATAVAEG